MDKVRKPSNSVCYTPSSEPYRIFHCCSLFSSQQWSTEQQSYTRKYAQCLCAELFKMGHSRCHITSPLHRTSHAVDVLCPLCSLNSTVSNCDSLTFDHTSSSLLLIRSGSRLFLWLRIYKSPALEAKQRQFNPADVCIFT
jgi:hypothetical protein